MIPIKKEVMALLKHLLEGPYRAHGGQKRLCADLGISHKTLYRWRDPDGTGIRSDNLQRLYDVAEMNCLDIVAIREEVRRASDDDKDQ